MPSHHTTRTRSRYLPSVLPPLPHILNLILLAALRTLAALRKPAQVELAGEAAAIVARGEHVARPLGPARIKHAACHNASDQHDRCHVPPREQTIQQSHHERPAHQTNEHDDQQRLPSSNATARSCRGGRYLSSCPLEELLPPRLSHLVDRELRTTLGARAVDTDAAQVMEAVQAALAVALRKLFPSPTRGKHPRRDATSNDYKPADEQQERAHIRPSQHRLRGGHHHRHGCYPPDHPQPCPSLATNTPLDQRAPRRSRLSGLFIFAIHLPAYSSGHPQPRASSTRITSCPISCTCKGERSAPAVRDSISSQSFSCISERASESSLVYRHAPRGAPQDQASDTRVPRAPAHPRTPTSRSMAFRLWAFGWPAAPRRSSLRLTQSASIHHSRSASSCRGPIAHADATRTHRPRRVHMTHAHP